MSHDYDSPQPLTDEEIVDRLKALDGEGVLTKWEHGLIESVSTRSRWPLSEKQRGAVIEIIERLEPLVRSLNKED
jgi:hypothetical protein